MTREDIIRMAREAGGDDWGIFRDFMPEIECFAALVYAEGHKDGLDDFEAGVLPAAIKAEREACAKVAEWVGQDKNHIGIAAAIRARGQHD